MKNIPRLRELDWYDAALKRAAEARMEYIQRAQNCCNHPVVSLRESAGTEYSTPFRVCVECGLAEKGWGYKTLGREIRSGIIARLHDDEARKFVINWV